MEFTRWFQNLPEHVIWNTVITSRKNIFSLSPHTLGHSTSHHLDIFDLPFYLSTTHNSQSDSSVTDHYSRSY